MTNYGKILALCLAPLALTACVGSNAGDDATVAAPTKNPDGQARVIVYRSSYYGLAVQPKLFLDGKEIGTCAPGNVISVPVKAGPHVISGRTLAEEKTSVNVPAAENVYVECSIGLGVIMGRLSLKQAVESEAAPKVKKMQGN